MDHKKLTSPPPPPPPTTILRRLINLDTTISLNLYTLTHPILPYFLLKSLEISGDGFLFFPVIVSFLLFPSLTPNAVTVYPLLCNLLIGGLLDLLIIGLLKHLIRRPRPVYNKNMSVAFAVDHFSFPSGHSSRVFFIATLFQLSSSFVQELLLSSAQSEFSNATFLINNLITIIWTWATLTSISRILLGRHFVFDVVVGMLVGVLEGTFVCQVLNYQKLGAFFFR